MDYYFRNKSASASFSHILSCSSKFPKNSELDIWMTIPTGKPDAFYEGVNPIWHLQEELDINNVSKLCKKNKWEF